jgi:hypothetical protein
VTTPGQEIVYDNTSEVLGPDVGAGPPEQLGNEITLAGTARVITDFLFSYNSGPGVHVTVRFYANDGAKSAPGTRLFKSEPVAIDPGPNETTLSGLRVHVPDTFTWTVSYTAPADSGFGIYGYSPPTIGSCGPMWCGGPSFWFTDTFETSAHHKASGLGARVTAVESLAHPAWPQEIVAQVLSGVINDAGGSILVGGHVVRVPPREPVEAILASLPAQLTQKLLPIIESPPPSGVDSTSALRKQFSQAIAQYQKESRG